MINLVLDLSFWSQQLCCPKHNVCIVLSGGQWANFVGLTVEWLSSYRLTIHTYITYQLAKGVERT